MKHIDMKTTSAKRLKIQGILGQGRYRVVNHKIIVTEKWEIINPSDVTINRQGTDHPCVGIWSRSTSSDVALVHSKNKSYAKLIAAAPDLLAALEAALPLLPHASTDANDVLHPVLGQAWAAIAKAKLDMDYKEIGIAWATASNSNGKIMQWSKLHRTVFGKFTLCGVEIPHKKQIRLSIGEKDFRASNATPAIIPNNKPRRLQIPTRKGAPRGN